MNNKIRISTALICIHLMVFSMNAYSTTNIISNLTKNAKLLTNDLLAADNGFELTDINYQDTDLYENSYLPIDLKIRKNSIILEKLTIKQSKIIHSILSELLSSKGYSKLLINLMIDKQYNLLGVKKNTDHILKIYGNPNHEWGMKVEGYHLSLSFLIKNNQLQFINIFIGQDTDLINGTEYSTYQLYDYAQNGYGLMNSLHPKQMQKAYLGISTPTDIMNNPNHYKPHLKQRSLNSKKLNKKQKLILVKWINDYLSLINPTLIKNFHEQFDEDNYDDINISWSGSFKHSQNKYYFMFNESIFIEYNHRLKHLHNIIRIKF